MSDSVLRGLLVFISCSVVVVLSLVFYPTKKQSAEDAVRRNDIQKLTSILGEFDVNSSIYPKRYPGGLGDSTLLHLAASESNPRTVEFLLASGADPCKRNAHRKTPLINAVCRSTANALDVVELFSKDGRSLDLLDNKGTPLHWCAVLGRVDMGKMLISHGANIELKNRQKQTPLHLSIREKNWEFARLLLIFGADPMVSDGKKTPLDYASEKEIQRELQEYIKTEQE